MLDKQAKWMTITGWVLTALVGLALAASAMMKITGAEAVAEQLVAHLGFNAETGKRLGFVEIACAAILLVPQTRVLGAILVTGYLGGAVSAHVRVGDSAGEIAPAIVLAALAWLGLVLRDARVRKLLPIAR